jgi:hypothetical protein
LTARKGKNFPHLYSLDVDNLICQQVNRFGMPLLEGTGITNVGGNFTFFFALVSHEDATSFTWALEQYRSILRENNIPDPEVILSDFDTAFKNAADVVSPDVQQQLCLWHILKNVVLHIKKKWKGTLGDLKIMGDMEGKTNADPSRTTGKLCDSGKQPIRRS